MKELDYWEALEERNDAWRSVEQYDGTHVYIRCRISDALQEAKKVLSEAGGARQTARLLYMTLLLEAAELGREFNVEHPAEEATEAEKTADRKFHEIAREGFREKIRMERMEQLDAYVKEMSLKEFREQWHIIRNKILGVLKD